MTKFVSSFMKTRQFMLVVERSVGFNYVTFSSVIEFIEL